MIDPSMSRNDDPPLGKIMLWHPESPGMRVIVRPGFWRRIGLVRSEFATLREVLRMYREEADDD